MQIIPVLDLLHGVVVRAIGGKRGEYRPIVSRLVGETSALAVARAYRTELGLDCLYLADLDAILDRRPNVEMYGWLRDDGFQVMVDAGIRSVDDARTVLAGGGAAVVVGLETIPAPALLGELCREFGPERIVFSLDLRGGVPMGDLAPWGTTSPFAIAGQVFELGVRRMIVLDLASGGVGGGVSTRGLCAQVGEAYPELELTTGGGARSIDDLRALQAAGIHGALVASALHDGRISREDIRSLPGGGG